MPARVLFPTLRDIEYEYVNNFQGMTADPIPLLALLAARERMIRELQHGIDANERRFLLSLAGAPEWPLLGIAHLEQLPRIRWELRNLLQLQKSNARRFAQQTEALRTRLASVPPSSARS